MSRPDVADLDTLHPVEPIDWRDHTMPPDSLLRYLEIKTHHLIQERDWDRITVVGDYNRLALISTGEKADKPFNWQRPSASVQGSHLVLHCYPGLDYVRHYALIISTYLAMAGRPADQVRYQLPDPAQCDRPLYAVQGDFSAYSAVITGWGLPQLTGLNWHRREGNWMQAGMLGGKPVLYLGFLHSIWGDAAGRMVHRLAELGARRVVYLGKVGGLDPEIEPNTMLASGCTSMLHGTEVRWNDFFGGTLADMPDVRIGRHVSSPTILLEGKAWLARQAGMSFVDPEIGPMGQAAARNGIPFGYLHIVSNNLARIYAADLSNERKTDVLHRRARLVERIKQLLTARLAGLEH